MLCDKCGLNEATVHLCEIRRGIPSEFHLCTRCADMFLPLERADLADLLEQLPPRPDPTRREDTLYLEREPEPEPGQVDMTAVGQHILVGSLDGGELRPVTEVSERSVSPSWSPGSQLIAHYVFSSRQGNCLRIVTPGGRELQRFYSVVGQDPVQWTPDGEKVCFSWVSAKSAGISDPVLADARSGAITPTFQEPRLATGGPLLSPDGRRWALDMQEASGKPMDLVVMNLDGSERRRLLHEETRMLAPLSWSPDSRMLAVLVCDMLPSQVEDELNLPEFGTRKLCVMDVRDGRVLFEFEGAERGCWSPDGTQFLFAVLAGRSWRLMRVARGRWTQPECLRENEVWLPGAQLSPEQWSGDGRVAYVAGGEHQCYVTGLKEPLKPMAVTVVGWRPRSKELGLLVGHDVLLVDPNRPRESTVVVRVPAEEYYDVVGMRWSPDGTMLAIEAHSAERAV